MRRALALLLLGAVLAGCGGKPKEHLYTIAVYQYATNAELDATKQGFVDALAKAGYKDGEKVRIQYENAQLDLPTCTLIAKKLADSDVDMICAIGTPALQTSITQVKEKPIVFGAIANPFLLGAGESNEKHLPNVTGASATSPIGEAMKEMLEVLPEARTIGVVYDPSNANAEWNRKVAQESADKLGIKVEEVVISSSSDVLQAARSLVGRGIKALFLFPDHVVRESSDSMIKVANETKTPLISMYSTMAEQGAPVVVGWDFYDNGVLTGELAVRIMKGESPATIPFQPLKKKLIYVNPAAAEKQGFRIPPEFLKKADKVFE